MSEHFDPTKPKEHRFGDAFAFNTTLNALGENSNTWTANKLTWCGVLKAKGVEQGLLAETLRTTQAMDGVRTMLEDRKRLQARSRDVGAPLLEICCDDLSPESLRSEHEWARLSAFLNVSARPSEALSESHSTSDASVDRSREDLTNMASQHLRMLLSEELLDETFPCYAAPAATAATTEATAREATAREATAREATARRVAAASAPEPQLEEHNLLHTAPSTQSTQTALQALNTSVTGFADKLTAIADRLSDDLTIDSHDECCARCVSSGMAAYEATLAKLQILKAAVIACDCNSHAKAQSALALDGDASQAAAYACGSP